MSVHTILMLIACIFLLCAAIGRPNTAPVALGWLGLFFWALDILAGGFSRG